MASDGELLRQYHAQGAQAAFTALVQRHLNLVYRTALRRVGGNAAAADDVTQRVFLNLAQKAGNLAGRETLAGWLYTSTRYASAELVRGERRRRTHEQEAQSMNEIFADELSPDRLEGLLDDVIATLPPAEQEIVVLHFFEGRTFSEIGAVVAGSADACRMRLNRSMERLRRELSRRGISSTGAALATALSAHGAVAPNLPQAAAVAARVFAQVGLTSALGGSLLVRVLAFFKASPVVVGVGTILLLSGAGLFLSSRPNPVARAENRDLALTPRAAESSTGRQPAEAIDAASVSVPAAGERGVRPSAFSRLTPEEKNLLAMLWREHAGKLPNQLPSMSVGRGAPNIAGIDRLIEKEWAVELETDRMAQRRFRLTVAGLRFCATNQTEIEAFSPTANLRGAGQPLPSGP